MSVCFFETSFAACVALHEHGFICGLRKQIVNERVILIGAVGRNWVWEWDS